MPGRIPQKLSWPAIIIFFVGLALSILAYSVTHDNLKIRMESDFHKISVEWASRVETSIKARVQMLNSIQAFYAASFEVSEDEFRVFARSVQTGYPSFIQIGWAPSSTDGRSVLVEYFEGHEDIILKAGHDLATHPSLKETIQKAIDSGKIVAFPLPADLRGQIRYMVISFVPVYRNAHPTDSVESRRENFRGFVFAVSNVSKTVSNALDLYDDLPTGIELALYQGNAIDETRLIYRHRSAPHFPASSEENQARIPPYTNTFGIAQNTWTIACFPTDHFFLAHPFQLPWLTFVIGILLTILTSAYASLFFRRQRQIADTVKIRLAQLEGHIKKIAKMQAIDQFVTGMVHEFNNPLSVVSSNAQLLKSKVSEAPLGDPLKSEILDEVLLIQTHAKRCSDIAKRFFSLSRQEADGRIEPVNVNECVQTVLKLLEKQLLKSSVETTLDLKPLPLLELPRSPLEQVLMNIIINAIHAMPQGGRLTIKSSLNNASSVVLQLIDTGTGIVPLDLPRVFEPFFTTKASGQGVGLGLAVCQSVMKNLGGDIRIESTEGKGTTVTLTLPVKTESGLS